MGIPISYLLERQIAGTTTRRRRRGRVEEVEQ